MAREVFRYRTWCQVDSKWVYGWSTEAPTACFEDAGHSIDSSKTSILESVVDGKAEWPKGSGFQRWTPDFTEMTTPWELLIAEGKKIVLRRSLVIFNTYLQGTPKIVFEVHRKLQLGQPGDPQYYCVDQIYYESLSVILAAADKVEAVSCGECAMFKLDFAWPVFDSTNRKPTILYDTDKIKVYLTDDARHSGVGVGGTNEYFIVGGVAKIFNAYVVSSSPPTWPDPPPFMKTAHCCFHLISFDSDVELPGE